MKRYVFIVLLSCVVTAFADDYVDDVYYSQKTALLEQLESTHITPQYNKKEMKELVFLSDTTATDMNQQTTDSIAH